MIVISNVMKLSPHSGTFSSSTSDISLYCDLQADGDVSIWSIFSTATTRTQTNMGYSCERKTETLQYTYQTMVWFNQVKGGFSQNFSRIHASSSKYLFYGCHYIFVYIIRTHHMHSYNYYYLLPVVNSIVPLRTLYIPAYNRIWTV